jgi:hypothetical protein
VARRRFFGSSNGSTIRRRTTPWICLVALGFFFCGCGESAPEVDDAPFRAAITKYLDSRNMAMKVKQVKRGPTIEGDAAELEASLVHREIPGPSVTWTFYFTKRSDGQWAVDRHED